MSMCWKFISQNESCAYLCGCFSLICPCKKKTIVQINRGIYLPTDSETTSIRRISRIDSEESLDDVIDRQQESDGCISSSPPLSTSSSYKKVNKKISLRRIATKAIKSYSTPSCTSDGEVSVDQRDEKRSKNRKFLTKSLTVPGDDYKREEEIEMKHKFKSMLRESRKVKSANKIKTHVGLPTILADLPPHPSCQNSDNGKEDDKSKIIKPKSPYGSMLFTAINKNDLISDDKNIDLSTRAEYESYDPLAPEVAGVEESTFSIKESSVNLERGEGDGSDIEMGSKENPVNECFGSITVSTKLISTKMVSLNVISLQGLPCRQGNDSGLCLELKTLPSGKKSMWLPLPLAQGSKVTVNTEVSLKLSTSTQKQLQEEYFIHIEVWIAGRTMKHCSIGQAIVHGYKSQETPINIGLYQHSQVTNSIGILELSLCSNTENTSKKNSPAKLSLTVQILRAKFSADVCKGKQSSAGLKHLKRSNRDIWCRVSLWSKGKRVEKINTPRIYLPITNDPVFRESATFHISRPNLPFTSLVIKVMCDRGLGEDVIGKLIFGPHLYLGVSQGTTPPAALSHWGRALTHAGEVSMWHKLYL